MSMKKLFVFLLLLALYSCREFPTQEEMDKAVQFGSGAKFCQESEDMDILSLTDSKGKNIREYHKPDWEEKKFKYLKHAIARYDQNLGGILSNDKNRQIVRLYRDSKPFTGKAKLCLDSFAIELMQKPYTQDYWIKKKAVVMEEVNVVDGWLNGEYIQYDYRIDDDWKTIVTFKQIKKYKKGKRHGHIEENGYSGNFVNGNKEGPWVERGSKGNYVNGKREGLWEIDGYKGNYVNGKKEGPWVENGGLGGLRKGNYINGIRTGVWTYKNTNDDGQVIDSITYDEGKVVTEKRYKNGKYVPNEFK